uniref:Protein kinase domain-containing protein n=1 Tax=Macrostomum lignano TaxID=282301 RepID=A0A1I8IYK5_9PLAT
HIIGGHITRPHHRHIIGGHIIRGHTIEATFIRGHIIGGHIIRGPTHPRPHHQATSSSHIIRGHTIRGHIIEPHHPRPHPSEGHIEAITSSEATPSEATSSEATPSDEATHHRGHIIRGHIIRGHIIEATSSEATSSEATSSRHIIIEPHHREATPSETATRGEHQPALKLLDFLRAESTVSPGCSCSTRRLPDRLRPRAARISQATKAAWQFFPRKSACLKAACLSRIRTLINGSIVWIHKPSIFCCSARIDPMSMPCELQQFQVVWEWCLTANIAKCVDLLRRGPEGALGATLLFNRVFQYGLLICLSLLVVDSRHPGLAVQSERLHPYQRPQTFIPPMSRLPQAATALGPGIGMFFMIAWFFFIAGLLTWKLLRARRLNVHVNRLLLRRKILLTVLDYEYLTCSCDILTSHMTRMFDKPELLSKARFSRKLTRIIDQIRRSAMTSNDPSATALLGPETQQPPQLPPPTQQQQAAARESAAAEDAVGLHRLPAAQKKALAKFLFLSYSSQYCNWLLRHKLPRPRVQRHTQTNIPCVCQLAETINFGQECLINGDNAVCFIRYRRNTDCLADPDVRFCTSRGVGRAGERLVRQQPVVLSLRGRRAGRQSRAGGRKYSGLSEGRSGLSDPSAGPKADMTLPDMLAESPQRQQQALFRCVAQNDLGRVGELLRQSHVDVNGRDSDNHRMTPLMRAAWANLPDMIRLLLKAGARLDDSDSESGASALHIAARENASAAVAALIDAQANVDARDRVRRTPLMLCAALGHRTVGEQLLRAGADTDLQRDTGYTAMHLACERNHLDFARLLVEFGARLDIAANRQADCHTPFTLAARLGHVEMLRLLATRGATVAAQRCSLGTALQVAVRFSQDEAASFLSKLQKDRPPELPSASRCSTPRQASTISDSDTDTDESDTSEYDDTDSSSDLDTAATVSADGTLAPSSRAAPPRRQSLRPRLALGIRQGNFDAEKRASRGSTADPAPADPELPPPAPAQLRSPPQPCSSKPSTPSSPRTMSMPRTPVTSRTPSSPSTPSTPSPPIRPSLLPKRQTKYRTIRSSRICRNNGASEDDSPLNSPRSSGRQVHPLPAAAVAEAAEAARAAAANQFVAVKVVKLSANASPQQLQRVIRNEEKGVRLLSRLNHRNILKFLKTDRDHQGNFCIFTELLSGNSLAGILEEYGGICSALDYIHTRSPPVLHWDLKCSNVMLTNEGVIKLIDFGLAKEIAASMAANATEVVGTPCFIPPEILDGGNFTDKSDIWSLGCTSSRWPPGRHPTPTRRASTP